MTKFEKIIISLVALLFIVVLVFGAVILNQQRAIKNLAGSSKAGAPSVAPASATAASAKTDNANPADGAGLQDTIKQFSGVVKSVSAGGFVIAAELTDFSKPKDPGKIKNAQGPVHLSPDDFAVMEKNITVAVDANTNLAGKSLSDLKVGDTVNVNSNESPYSQDKVIAQSVSILQKTK